jgi:hypothetical protein
MSELLRDGLAPVGVVEIFTTIGRPRLILSSPVAGRPKTYREHELDFSGCQLLLEETHRNIIVNIGKDKTVEALAAGSINPIMRMAIGDRGTLPSDPTVPKIPVSTMSALYNEIYRADIDAVIITTGTPTDHKVKFIRTFSAVDVPITSFSNQATPVVNEVALITADTIGGAPFPRLPVAAPAAPPVDEAMYSIRTYRSVPFVAANDIAVTIRYTIFIE